jgi:muramidase (phage lysozyme)
MILSGLTNNGIQNKSYAADPKVRAFLDMIAQAEGTAQYPNRGYNTLYTGIQISDLNQHPNRAIKGGGITSTAAGRYQFLYKTWQGIAAKTGTANFQPESQDINAIQLLKDYGALNYILSGDIQTAISKVKKVWASFPGAGYGQGERSLTTMLNWYNTALSSYTGQTITEKKKINSGTGIMQAGFDTDKLLIAIAAAAGLTIFINIFKNN